MQQRYKIRLARRSGNASNNATANAWAVDMRAVLATYFANERRLLDFLVAMTQSSIGADVSL